MKILTDFLLAVMLGLSAGQPPGAEPHVVLQQQFSDTSDHECKYASSVPDGSIWLLVVVNEHHPPADFELWRLDPGMKRVLDIRTADLTPADKPSERIRGFYGIAGENDGSVAVLGLSVGGSLELTVVAPSGRILVRKQIGKDRGNDFISRFRTTPDGLLTAVGRLGSSASVLRFRPDGTEPLEYTLNDPELEVLEDVVQSGPDELGAVGVVRRGKGKVLAVVKLGTDGVVRAKVELPEAFVLGGASICWNRKNSGYTVAYYAVDPSKRNMSIVARWFDGSLAPGREVRLTYEWATPLPLALLPTEAGDVVIAANARRLTMRLIWLTADGTLLRTLERPALYTSGYLRVLDTYSKLVEQPAGFALIVSSTLISLESASTEAAAHDAIRVMTVR